MTDTVERAAQEPDFAQSLQGLAAMCDSYSRGGSMCAMPAEIRSAILTNHRLSAACAALASLTKEQS